MFQNGFYVSIRKTDKREVNDEVSSLPPDNGPFDEYKVSDYLGCPKEWSKDGVFIPVKESQPLWFDFRGNMESACLASVQKVNPVTGESADLENGISKDPLQNYLKLPDQLWLDGYSKDGKVYQFVVVTEGKGDAVNEVVLPKHLQDSHAMGFAFYLPKITKRAENPKITKRAENPMVQPMWYSPLHTPQNWTTASNRRVSSNSSSSARSCNRFKYTVNDSNVTRAIGGLSSNSINYDSNAESLISFQQDENNGNFNSFENNNTILLNMNAKSADISSINQASMGAGGRIGQDIINDNNTVEYYQEKPAAILSIYFALPEMFKVIITKGKRQDASKKDKYKTSGHIGGVAVPLVS